MCVDPYLKKISGPIMISTMFVYQDWPSSLDQLQSLSLV